jgi:PAS domain S-box-containing protein
MQGYEKYIDKLTEVFSTILKGEKPALIELPPDFPENEIKQLTAYFNKFIIQFNDFSDFTFKLSQGDLNLEAPAGKTRMLQSIKSIQSDLKHLTWKTQKITKGDYNQKVSFMGEFSTAFNSLTDQLRESKTSLEKKIEERTKELVKFKLCIDRSFEAIFITDAEGQIIFINPAFEQMYGFSPDEAIGKTPRIIKSSTYSEDVYHYFWKTLLSKEAVAGEIINKTKDGKLITVEGFNNAILDSEGDIIGYIGIHRDITEHKKAEESLKLFKTLIDNSNDAFEVVDPATGRFLDINEAGCKALGYSREEFLKLSVFDIDPVVTPQSFAEIVKKLRESGSLTWEGIHKRKDGTSFPVEVNIRIVSLEKEYMVTVARDISLRKQNEESVLKLSRAVEQSPTSVMITDRKGMIEYINPKLTEVTGYKNEEVLGKNPRIFSSGEKPKSEYEILWKNIQSGKEWKGEFHNKKKNGELYWENANISPIINSKGIITHFVAIKEDITERKKMIEELILAKEKAEESDRLKSAFLTNMSHEIRTPMNGILGFTALLKEHGLTGEEQKAYIEIIEKSGDRMLNTINDIIDISKIEAGQMEVNISEVNVNELMEYLFSFFKPEAEKKGIQLSVYYGLPNNEAIIAIDREKLDSILTNLVKNAIKYTREGSINFGYEVVKTQFCTSLQFYVKDTGIGIPKERQQAIFDRFVKADIEDKNAMQGSGLGLTISKAYVEMLGGKIWVESETAKGSVFYFGIPCKETSEGRKDEQAEIPVTAEKPQTRKLNILIVEDEEASEMFLTIAVKSISKNIFVAKTGIEAIEICKNNPDIDLVLMDIQMAGMNGYEATQQIREFNKEVIIIAQTAFALNGDSEKALEAGCNAHISKPIKKEELVSLIQKHLK